MGSVDRQILGIDGDLGEGFGRYGIGDRALPSIYAADIGGSIHADDPVVMRDTSPLANEIGVSVGAHASRPDPQGFGRHEMTIGPEAWRCRANWFRSTARRERIALIPARALRSSQAER
jgi:lactam utilization protein B